MRFGVCVCVSVCACLVYVHHKEIIKLCVGVCVRVGVSVHGNFQTQELSKCEFEYVCA